MKHLPFGTRFPHDSSRFHSLNAPATIDQAVAILQRGGLVALPTETVYGLGADADNPAAMARMFAAKGRPTNHPVIVHLAEAEQISDWARETPPAAWKLAEAFWPGPLTLILPRAARVLDAVTGGQDTVGLRVPSHPVAHELLARFGGGIAAPSANRFGRVSPTRPEHVYEELGDLVDCILDGGDCTVGLESTILDLSRQHPALLRPGWVTREQIEAVLGQPLASPDAASPRASGSLASHYAPQAQVEIVPRDQRLDRSAELAAKGMRVALLAPPNTTTPPGVNLVSLPDYPDHFAQRLYAALREADTLRCEIAVVSYPPEEGIGEAIRDRLKKASAR